MVWNTYIKVHMSTLVAGIEIQKQNKKQLNYLE